MGQGQFGHRRARLEPPPTQNTKGGDDETGAQRGAIHAGVAVDDVATRYPALDRAIEFLLHSDFPLVL